jgi:hypothetical protein
VWYLAAAAAALLVSLPYWLPAAVVALRVRIFAWVNGQDAIAVPGPLVGIDRFKAVYAHPAADGRSRGAALSDLFWYWLSPGAEIHQEHLEPGPRYAEVAATTRRILHLSHAKAAGLAARCTAKVMDELDVRGPRLVRLRDALMPVWAEFYYELVFGLPCPPQARRLIVDNAGDVATALKCCGLRHLDRRHRLTEFLVDRVRAGAVAHQLPRGLSTRQRAFYLQGTFFNTAIVQMSEATAHLLMVLAQHPGVRERLAADPSDDRYLDHVIDETLRLYPLFGIAHRITSADIAVDSLVTIPRGSVLCFNYPEFHRAGFDDPARFDPDRWQRLSARDANHIPFGVPANRPCPAWHLAPVTMRAAAREVLARFDLCTSARHTRALPNRGPCLLLPRAVRYRRRAALLVWIRVRDRVEDVTRSIVQLVLGTYMVVDARRLRLCGRYFGPEPPQRAERPEPREPPATDAGSSP